MRSRPGIIVIVAVSCFCVGCTGEKSAATNERRTATESAPIEREPKQQNPEAQLRELEAQFNAGVEAIRTEMLETLSKDEVNDTLWRVGPFERMQHLGPQFLQLATDHPGTEVAWDSLRWVVYTRGFSSEDKASAADQMIRDFADDTRLHEDLYGHFYRPGVVDKAEFYERVVNAPQVPERVRGLATYCLAVALVGEGRVASQGRALSQLDKVIAEYGELPHPFDPAHGSLGDAARRLRNELLHLQIGMVAPNIIGEDVKGESFQLSSYRGKVVLLVFCGDWCAPCRLLYPHEKALLNKHKGAAFAVVGVNSDDRETLESAIQREAFPFRWFSDGSTAGPISLDWNVKFWPTLYVLDREGTICFKQIGSSDTDSLDQAIDELLHGRDAAGSN